MHKDPNMNKILLGKYIGFGVLCSFCSRKLNKAIIHYEPIHWNRVVQGYLIHKVVLCVQL